MTVIFVAAVKVVKKKEVIFMVSYLKCLVCQLTEIFLGITNLFYVERRLDLFWWVTQIFDYSEDKEKVAVVSII